MLRSTLRPTLKWVSSTRPQTTLANSHLVRFQVLKARKVASTKVTLLLTTVSKELIDLK